MSTKSTIHYEADPQTEPPPPTYTHVYTDCFDDGPIQPVYIEQGRDSVVLTAAALAKLFAHIERQIAHVSKSAAETDAGIEATVRKSEAEKTAHHAEWVATGSLKSTPLAWLSIGGETPEEDRIAHRLAGALEYRYRAQCAAALEKWRKDGASA